MLKENSRQRRGSKITWISFQVLDSFLSKTALIGVSNHLAERGNHVDFFAIRSKKVFRSSNPNLRLVTIPLRTFPIVTHILYAVLLAIILPFHIAIRRPDFILTGPRFGSSVFSLELRLFPRLLRPKVILDIRSTPVEVHDLRASLGALWFNISVIMAGKTFDGITIATRQMKNDICSKFSINPESVRVWNNGVDLTLFWSEKYDEYDMRKRLGLTGKFVVFYHGSFSAHRGVTETIESIKILEEDYPDLVLFLLGSGSALPLFEYLIRRNKLQDRVIIHAPVDYVNVPRYIAICDVGIVPLPDIRDWRHQCPLKLIEYLAMEKTVIATDIPANREVIGMDKSGIYVASADPEKIAKAIAYVYDNRGRLKEWGSSGRTIVTKKYDWKKVAENLERYLQEFARRTPNA